MPLDGPIVIRVILEQFDKQLFLTELEIFLQVLTVANDAPVAALCGLLDQSDVCISIKVHLLLRLFRF